MNLNDTLSKIGGQKGQAGSMDAICRLFGCKDMQGMMSMLQSKRLGHSWRLGGTYIVVEQSPAMTGAGHDRHRPGLNHLAFHAGSRQDVDSLAAGGPDRGWTLLFAGQHPYAGGPDHYAAYLASTDSFEVELVAGDD